MYCILMIKNHETIDSKFSEQKRIIWMGITKWGAKLRRKILLKQMEKSIVTKMGMPEYESDNGSITCRYGTDRDSYSVQLVIQKFNSYKAKYYNPEKMKFYAKEKK